MDSVLSLEDRLQGLTLTREEDEDLDFSEELEGLIKDVRWLELFRVHTTLNPLATRPG